MATLTIEISDEMKAYYERIAAEQGVGVEEVARRALAGERLSDALDELRKDLAPRAESLGFRSEQDIYDAFS